MSEPSLQTPRLPSISLLSAFKIIDDGASVSYPNLESVVQLVRETPYKKSLELEANDFAALRERRNAARIHVVEVGYRLLSAKKRDDHRRYTQEYMAAMNTLYGMPDPATVGEIANEELKTWYSEEAITLANQHPEVARTAEMYATLSNAFFETESRTPSPSLTPEERSQLKQGLESLYADFFRLLDSLYKTQQEQEFIFNAEWVHYAFTQLITTLAFTEDTHWREWKAFISPTRSHFSTSTNKRFIIPGLREDFNSRHNLKALALHEMIVHGGRSVHARTLGDPHLCSQMDGFLDAEEGIGLLGEYLVLDERPERARDRYIDIALAVGLLDKPFTREELVRFYVDRSVARSLIQGRKKQSKRIIARKAISHVNRIIKIVPSERPVFHADDQQAVFTKDLVYYRGLKSMEAWTKERLKMGWHPEYIWSYLLGGHFDPMNPDHVLYLGKIDYADKIFAWSLRRNAQRGLVH